MTVLKAAVITFAVIQGLLMLIGIGVIIRGLWIVRQTPDQESYPTNTIHERPTEAAALQPGGTT